VSTVHGMFASRDEQEMHAILREVDELRRARRLQQLGRGGRSSATVSSVLAVQPRSTAATVPRRAPGEHSVATTLPGLLVKTHPPNAEVPFGRDHGVDGVGIPCGHSVVEFGAATPAPPVASPVGESGGAPTLRAPTAE
jgi:hypothetical protein